MLELSLARADAGLPWHRAVAVGPDNTKAAAIIVVSFPAARTAAGSVLVPSAVAAPDQRWSIPFSGFCDQSPDAVRSFRHCAPTGFGSSLQRICYQGCLDGGGRLHPIDYRLAHLVSTAAA
jgi:hypothetical protein